ncbi:MAG: Uma2 family endonuclease [Chloroflexi bacterium]|nr:Uma2 family endonuclease [Chloroflexota bacterium]
MTQVARSPRPGPVLTPSDSPEYVATARMTWDEWLDWRHNGLVEWVDGVAYDYGSTTWEHETIVRFLSTLLGTFAEERDAGAVIGAPYALRSVPDHIGREPDVMFIATAHREYEQSRFMTGPPDIIVEVVSEDSERRDTLTKLLEYQALGAREYWLIDSRPGERLAQFVVLDDQGKYRKADLVDGVFHSTVLAGFWLRTDWLWEEHPRALAAFREITAASPPDNPPA